MGALAERRWSGPVLLAGWCAVLFVYGIDRGELYRTEGLRAGVAAEALRTGDWLVPSLYGEPFLTKPPGQTAAIALTSWPIGRVTEVTARLPSALAATATVFLFAWHFGRVLGPRGGLVAGLVLPVSFLWLDKVPSAEIDALQAAWVSGSVLLLFRAIEAEEEGRPARGWWLLAFLCLAGGTLTKWTAPAFLYLTALPLLAWRRRLGLLLGRGHLAGLALAMCLCLGWLAWAGHRVGWPVLIGTIGREAAQHLSPGHRQEAVVQMGPAHRSSLGYVGEALLHPFLVLAMNAPWSVLALATLWPGMRRGWDGRTIRLWQGLHCWLWPSLLFWALVPQHSSRQAFPMFPAFAGLGALAWTSRGQPMRPRALMVVLASWLVVKAAFVELVVPARTAQRRTRENGALLAEAVPAGHPLYFYHLKDDTLLYYFGRPARRWSITAGTDWQDGPLYCILEEREWQSWPGERTASLVLRLHDGQGQPLVLVTMMPAPIARAE